MNAQMVNTLLDIIDGTNPGKWPKLRPIHDLAMAELEEAVEDAKKELQARQEKKDAEAKAETEKVAAARKAKADPSLEPKPFGFGDNGNGENRRI